MNSTTPLTGLGRRAGCAGSATPFSVLSTSLMRSADTLARGTIINIMLMNKKLMITCMAYWIKAIISPTCRLLAAICLPPNHTISRLMPFITSIIAGIMVAMLRFTNRVL